MGEGSKKILSGRKGKMEGEVILCETLSSDLGTYVDCPLGVYSLILEGRSSGPSPRSSGTLLIETFGGPLSA